MPDAEFKAILTRAAEEGAKRALANVGLERDEVVLNIPDLRSLVECIRLARRAAMQNAVRMITTGVMLALLAGIAVKLKIFGGGPYLAIRYTERLAEAGIEPSVGSVGDREVARFV